MGIGQDIRTKCNDTYRLFREKAFSCPTLADQHARATNASSGEMRRVLGALDLIALGVGAIVGAGVFVLTGLAAREHAGPAVVLSYLFASLAAVLSAFAYAEYAVEMPFAGGAYNYVSLTFGEFAAWLVACNLMLEYTLSAATVARGFTGYVAALFDATTDDLTIGDPDSMFSIDFLAFGLILLESAILAYGTRQSASFNVGVTGANLAVIVFVIVLGFPNVKSSNYTPFLPFGWRGVFAGAAQVFFSFIGFDMITTAAEEVKNPAVNMPLGVITSLGICAVLYALMCLVITGMVSYELIDEFAPFAEAFRIIGWDWASYVVSIGAITGILTSLLVGLLGQARVYVVLGRDRLLPPWIARVNERTATPINATVVTALSAGLLALLVNINLLAELVSAGTLFVFYMVSMGVLVRRYWDPSVPRMRLWLGVRLAALSLCAVLFSVTYINRAHWALPATFLGMCAIVTASFLWLPQVYHPKTFATPLLPFLPCASMVVDLHLIGSLGTGEHGSLAFVRLAGMFVLALVLYLAYSMHHSYGSAAPPPQASELGQRQNGLASHGDVQMAALPGSDVVAKLPDSSPDTRRVSNGVGGAKAPNVEEARVEGSGDSSSSVQLLFGESDSSTADAWNSSSGLPL